MKLLDLSHWNVVTSWSKVKSEVDCVILKATQGTTFVDPAFFKYRDAARKQGLLVGHYHFSDGLNPIVEAEHFIKTIGELREGEFIALDWEINHENPVNWCLSFLNRCYELTDIRPLFYTNEARVKQYDWSPLKDFGLWEAKYGVNNGQMNGDPFIGSWPFLAIWQFTSRGTSTGITGPVDTNEFYGKLEALKSYGKKPGATPTIPEEFYWQRHPRYKDVKLGNSTLSFQNYGCFTCALSYIAQKDPLEVMELLKKNGGYSGSLVISEKAAQILNLDYLGKDTNINNMPDWSPSIKEVSLGRSQHFVVRLLDPKRTYDPWQGKELPLNYYSFRSYRLFKRR